MEIETYTSLNTPTPFEFLLIAVVKSVLLDLQGVKMVKTPYYEIRLNSDTDVTGITNLQIHGEIDDDYVMRRVRELLYPFTLNVPIGFTYDFEKEILTIFIKRFVIENRSVTLETYQLNYIK